jgi:phytoene synthase
MNLRAAESPAAGATAPSGAMPAAGSSFYAAMRLLPREKREAMFEIYAFCRAVDDIADGDGPRADRRAALEQWRADIDALCRGQAPAALASLAAITARFGLRREDFQAVIDGMEMDLAGDIRAPAMAELDLYCDRVASAVGRLSVRVFGLDQTAGDKLAHHLGRALQLTNILRDLDEDAGIGRLYLPREALAAAGIAETEPAAVLGCPGLDRACAMLVEKARRHFAEAEAVMDGAPRKLVKAPRLMGAVYGRILEGLVARGFASPRERVRLGRPMLIWILLRHGIL